MSKAKVGSEKSTTFIQTSNKHLGTLEMLLTKKSSAQKQPSSSSSDFLQMM